MGSDDDQAFFIGRLINFIGEMNNSIGKIIKINE
jgi:hypothetical protein